MKTNILLLLVILLGTSFLGANQNLAIGLTTPSMLNDGQGEIGIGHRFYGEVDDDPLDNFFGLNAGANINLYYRQHFVAGLEAEIGYIRENSRYNLDAAWLLPLGDAPLRAQLDADLSTFQKFDGSGRVNDLGVLLSLQNKPLFDRLILTLNGGYNTYYDRFAAGAGLNIFLTDSISLVGEYHPLLDTDLNSTPGTFLKFNNDNYAVGLMVDTWGHTFMLFLGNEYSFDAARLSLGSANKEPLRFGFNVRRRISF